MTYFLSDLGCQPQELYNCLDSHSDSHAKFQQEPGNIQTFIINVCIAYCISFDNPDPPQDFFNLVGSSWSSSTSYCKKALKNSDTVVWQNV